MNRDQLAKIFENAAELVKNLPEVLKPKAFEIAVADMKKAAGISSVVSDIQTSDKSEASDFFARLREKTGLDEANLKTVFRIDKNNKLKIIVTLDGKIADKQKKLGYLYFFASIIGFEKEWIAAREITKIIEEYGANDTHISRNLKLEKGKILYNSKEYGLTPNGLKQAEVFLKDLAEGKNG